MKSSESDEEGMVGNCYFMHKLNMCKWKTEFRTTQGKLIKLQCKLGLHDTHPSSKEVTGLTYTWNTIISYITYKTHNDFIFQLEEDLQNYRYLITMGGRARLKPGVVPHLFDCQGRGVTANNNRISLQRKRKIQEILTNKENTDPGNP